MERKGAREPAGRRHVGRRVLVALVVVVLAGIAPVVVVGPSDRSERTVAPAVPNVPTAPTAPTASTAPKVPTVLLVGDSLIHQAAVGIQAALPGATVVDGSVAGTGLLNGPVDWSARAATLLAKYHPVVVVVSFIGNYDVYAGRLVPDSPPYYAAWADAAQRLTGELRASGARVDWVEQPPLHIPNFYGITAGRTDMLLGQYRKLATEPGVGLVRAIDAIAGPDGAYALTHDVCGTTVTLRIADGVHFTDAGGVWWGVNLGIAVAGIEGFATRSACAVMAEVDPGQA
jgi:hypothetical protein